MGLTCAGCHIFAADVFEKQDRAHFDSVFDNACSSISYERVECDEPSQCDFVAVGKMPWFSFFDARSPGVITADLMELARALSAVVDGPVLLASVYDSDEFAFVLFHHGKQCDGHASSDDLLPAPVRSLSARKRAEWWSRLFGASLDDIHQVTQSAGIFADDQLFELCRVVGLPADQATLTPADLDRTDIQCACYRASAEISDASQIGGGPGFDGASPKLLEMFAGQVESPSFEVAVSTAALSNPILELSGSAIGEGLITVTGAGGLWHGGRDQVLAGGAQFFEAQLQIRDDGHTICSLSRGLSPDVFQQAPRPEVTLLYWFKFKATTEGRGDLRCRLLPESDNPRFLALEPEYLVTITRPSWLPLQGVKEGVIEQDGLRMLNYPKILSAVVIHEDRGEASFTELRMHIERWIATQNWPADARVVTKYEGQLNPTTLHLPKKKASFKLAEIGSAKKWQKLFDQPGALQSLFVDVSNKDGDPLGGTSIQRPCEDDEPIGEGTIHFAIWLAAAPPDMGTANVQRERARLTDFVDSSFESLGGIQAWLAHWDWVPRFGTAEENDYTPYEDACSVGCIGVEDQPGRYMLRGWCERYLRAVSEQVWLSTSLITRVDREMLNRVAVTTELGASQVRIDLLPDEQLPRLEEALLPILPSLDPQVGVD